MLKKLRNVLSNDEGQDIAEYAVMLAVILVLVIGTVRLIGGNANMIKNDVTSVIHENAGSRIIVIPGARILMIVVMKLNAAASDATPSNCKLNSQKSDPIPV